MQNIKLGDEMEVRVRFAPSPTGHLHIGGARTALFNFLYARQHNGKFILRIEDTDIERSTEDSLKQLISSLTWLGLTWDEGPEIGGEFGPYLQSDRLELYNLYSDKLLKEGKAYRCFCTAEELALERDKNLKAKQTPKYSGKCSNLSEFEIKKKLDEKIPFTIRFKVEKDINIEFKDHVHKKVSINTAMIGDFVIVRSNGLATYNFAVVIDDALMKITHVFRGDDHISNTPKQILIFKAMGFSIPEFGHLSMILGKDGSRLSKRHGATSVEEFKEIGYLPDAMVNYLALLGWYPKEGKDGKVEEILDQGELIEQFDIDSVSKHPARFNLKKLDWVNTQYIKKLSDKKLIQFAKPFLEKEGLWNADDLEGMKKIIGIIKFYISKISDFPEYAKLFFKEFKMDEKLYSTIFNSETKILAESLLEGFSNLEDYSPESIFPVLKEVTKKTKIKGRDFYMPLRLILTGQEHGPDINNIISVFGKDRMIKLLNNFIEFKK